MKLKNIIIYVFIIHLFCAYNLAAQKAVTIKKMSENGKPMLFLPHIGCSSQMWQTTAERYLKTNACYLIDFAGFAGLQPLQSNYSENYVQAIVNFIATNHLKECIIIGQNYGAFIAVKVAEKSPNNVSHLVLTDFFPKLTMVLGKELTEEKLEGILKSMKQNIISSDSIAFATYQYQTASGMNFMDTSYVPQFVNWQMSSDRQTLAGTFIEQMSNDLLPYFEKNRIPTLVFNTWYFGKTFKKMPFSESLAAMQNMYPQAQNVKHAITEDAKDFIAIDQPVWFKDQLDIFLKEKFGTK